MVIPLLAATHKAFGIRSTSDTKLNCWVAPLQNKILKPKFTKGNIQKKKKKRRARGIRLPEKEETRDRSAEPPERNDEEVDSAIEAFENLREHRTVELARKDRTEKALHGGAAEKEIRLSAIAGR
jgi:hypothetical protein